MQHVRRRRRYFNFCALAALLGTLALTLSQCTMVGDSLTGVQLSRGKPTSCTQSCEDAYKAAIASARKNHQAIISNCRMLSGQAERDCIDAENARYDAQLAQISADRTACLSNCHRQGAGIGG